MLILHIEGCSRKIFPMNMWNPHNPILQDNIESWWWKNPEKLPNFNIRLQMGFRTLYLKISKHETSRITSWKKKSPEKTNTHIKPHGST